MQLFLISLAIITPSLHAADSLARNPGFEVVAPEGDRPADWPLPERAGVRFSLDEDTARTGQRSARVDGTDPDAQDRYVQAWRQDIGPLPDGPLWFSAWVKADGVETGQLNVLHRADDGTVLLNQPTGSFAGTFDWREIGAQLRQVEGATNIQLVMGLVRSGGTVWFDDVDVSAVGDPADIGMLKVSPEGPHPAGGTTPMEVVVTLGEEGLSEGGAVSLRWENWRSAREFGLDGFAVECDEPGTTFEVSVPPPKTSWPPTPKPIACVATLTNGTLPAGARVRIGASLRTTTHTNVSCTLTGLVTREPGAGARSMAGSHTVSALGGPPAQLIVRAEARPVAGEPARVTVAALDESGNPATSFDGEVRLSPSRRLGLPRRYTFTPEDGGSHRFDARFPGGRVWRVTAECECLADTSNSVLPRAADEPGIYFGDIHVHCEISADAVGDPDLAYDHAKRFVGLDFAALSDHSPRGPAWKRATEVGNRHNEPGIFPTILGFEWSDGVAGHRNAYYRGDSGPEQPTGLKHNMEEWWEFLDADGRPALTIPHHPNTQSAAKRPDGKSVWGPMDWSVVTDKYQRVVEVNQNRGSFEVPGGPIPELRVMREDCGSSVQTALAKGHRMGFIGSTDAHSGRPGDGPARCAVLTGDYTREGLWDGLHDRSCYATSGRHTIVLFTVNDEPMGSEIAAEDAAAPREVGWRVVGTGPIERIDLIRNNEVVYSQEGKGRDDVAGAFSWLQPLETGEWYYLRVVQEDTEMAWSSPVWVDPAR